MSGFVVEHPRAVVTAWLLATALSLVAALGLFGRLTNRGFAVPGSDSARAAQLLAQEVPGRGGTELFVLATVRRPGPPDGASRGVASVVRRALRRQPDLRALAVVATAVEYGEDARSSEPAFADVLVSVRLATDTAGAEREVPRLRDRLVRASTARDRLELLGWPALSERYSTIAHRDLARAEAIAFPATFAVLLIAFLSVVAAALPVLAAAVALVVTFAGLFAVAHVVGLNVFVTNTASMLALGLSVDYALFIVTRYREEMRAGDGTQAAMRRTLATTGRAVVLSGATLSIALLSLFAVGVGLFTSMAIGATLGTVVAALAAVTLVPAAICLLGPRLERFTLRPAARAARRATLWRALGRAVVEHPLAAASVSLALLVAMALPASSLRLSMHTLSALPRDDVVRQAAARVGHSFSPGMEGPVDVVTRDDPATVVRILQRGRAVGAISGPVAGRRGWSALQTTVAAAPDSFAARRIVEGLRRRLARRPQRTYVGGPTALSIDLVARLSARTPYVVLIAVLLAAAMLTAGLRSIVIPIKAVLGTLLSVAATLGLVVRLFPDSEGAPSLEFFVPLFLFAIVFGLSIDYEVFLLSRIAEAVRGGSSNRDAVVSGLVRSARAMTLAGVTLATVFLAFATSSLASFRQLGAGVAIAILLDVTLVRCVLIPAGVVLLGRWNWWLPGERRRSGRSRRAAVPRSRRGWRG